MNFSLKREPLRIWIIAKQLRRNDNNHYARFYGIKSAFSKSIMNIISKICCSKLTSLLLSFFPAHTCENMPSVCNERGFTNIHKLFNIETCTISGRPLMQGFLMEVYHAKKRKGTKLSFTRLLNNKFLCFRQVVTKHKFK